ncbi:hypothetical protein [Leptolyngbya sp. PCC 6406]|nr:hypothetical protein [Leptolyngbya sp. PCC 6406]
MPWVVHRCRRYPLSIGLMGHDPIPWARSGLWSWLRSRVLEWFGVWLWD